MTTYTAPAALAKFPALAPSTRTRAADVAPGDYMHLAPHTIGGLVSAVDAMCNCQSSAQRIDVDTREPLHFPALRITSEATTTIVEPEHRVWVTPAQVTR